MFAVVVPEMASYTNTLSFSALSPTYAGPLFFQLTMRFALIDRIVELEPGARIAAVKSLSMAEEYLADHFPRFPVMPGVLMLEAMTQAGAWLVRASEDFAHSMVVLRQAGNVKYGRFVEPGHTLYVTAEILGQTENQTKLKAQGIVDGQISVSGRLVLERYNLADAHPARAYADDWVRKQMRVQFGVLYPGGARHAPTPNA
jgi:3-hydroxyacyl-[acyl-carrier-protein] dehydratase